MDIYLPGLCQSQSIEWAFWSNNFTWNTPNPNLTQCFQKTVLQWIPCGFFLLGMLWYIPYLGKKRVVIRRRVSCLNIFKNILSFGIIVLATHDLILTIIEEIHGENPPLVFYLHPVLSMITLTGVIFVTYYENIKGIHTSGFIWNFWFIQFISSLLVFISQIIYLSEGTQYNNRAITAIITSGIVLVQLILNSFADTSVLDHTSKKPVMNGEATPLLSSGEMYEDTTTHPPSPEIRASFLARFTFMWITKLLITAYKRPLTGKDAWALLKRHTTKFIYSRGGNLWKDQLKEIASKNRQRNNRSEQVKSDAYLLLREIKEADDVPYRKKKMPSLFVSTRRMYGMYYFYVGCQKLIADLIGIIQPQWLSVFIAFMGNPNDYSWHGYTIGLALFLTSLARTFIMQHHTDNSMVVGMNLRTFVIAHIYRKALKLSSSARKYRTVGEIVNLMAVDSQILQTAAVFMNQLWTVPIIIIIALVFLWSELGASTLAGVFIMLLLIPINAVLASRVRKLQTQQLKLKDQRIKLMTEILSGIKVLKLYSWERSFEQQIKDIRKKEARILRKAAYINAITSITWFCAALLVSLGSFTVYTLTGNILTSEKAFVSISLFNLMNGALILLPAAISMTVQFSVCMKRINEFLCAEEIDPNTVNENSMARDALLIQDGTFAWSNDGDDVLKNVNMTVPDGQLVAVVGTVGSGKTSLVSSMLGEMVKRSGRVTLKGTVAYVPQQAWCQNCTLQENILFGKDLNNRKYNKIIDACALRPDLEILEGGDQTEIGEKGINLSGGQKQRISLARAVYQDSDTYLLDDPLSAVDSHVGKHIFDKVIGPHGCLAGKTRIFVTHRINFLPKVDSILVMKDGVITETGSYSELLSKNGEFAGFLRQHLETEEDSEEDEEEEAADFKAKLRRSMDVTSGSESERSVSKRKKSSMSISGSHKRRWTSTAEDLANLEHQKKNIKRLIKLEEAETGNVRKEVFVAYARALGLVAVGVIIIGFFTYLGTQVANSIWLSIWTDDTTTYYDTAKGNFYLAIYGVLGMAQVMGIGILNFFLAYGMYSASIILHSDILKAIMNSPMSFFDTTPIGRIINRIGKDINVVDTLIPMTLRIWFVSMARVLSTLVIICVASPLFIIAIIPLGILYFFAQRFYICTSRQLKRIESLRRSPIYSHFQETLVGVSSVRAYKRQEEFIDKSDMLVDENQVIWYPNIVAQRWLGMTLEGIGAIIVFLAAAFGVLTRETIGPGLAGASVSYALQVTSALSNSVRMTCDLETYIIAVERIMEYIGLPSESILVNDGVEPSWPAEGRVEFCDYSVRYRPGLDLVLRNISTEIDPREKVGIIGRTGAGKSSLTLALFRILEPAGGSIKIDGVDITSLSLDTLRSRLTIIPQDPVLFSGTLRINLDPVSHHTDGEVWSALEQAHLKEFVAGLPDGLEYECAEGGENLSVGQRQLVCLARALLRKTKVLVLDEATAAVDLETDDLIQSTIRREFKDSTILTIAHRLNTIMDYDRIIVLDCGAIKESGSPTQLLSETNSVFHAMCRDAGLV